MRTLYSILIVLCFALPLQARINMIEPWSPGVDFTLPEKQWNHGVNVRLGVDEGDIFDLSYLLSHPLPHRWEIGGIWGLRRIDSPIDKDDNLGLNDLTVGGKHVFNTSALPKGLKFIGEAGLSLPTGDSDDGLGAGGVGIFLGWGMELPIQVVHGYSQLGVQIFTEGNDTDKGTIFNYVFGARYEIDSELSLTSDLRGFNHGKDKINGVRLKGSVQELFLTVGVMWNQTKNPVDFLGNILLGLTNESNDIGIMFGAKF